MVKMCSILTSRQSKRLSLDCRVTLLNSFLNSIPIFYFLFYKAPKEVIQDMIKIQRAFVWNDEENKKRINGVAWSTICKPKTDGGLWSETL